MMVTKQEFFKIGLEIHIQLNTTIKMFSHTKIVHNQKPNININNFDVGEPGTLPVINPDAISQALKIVAFLRCRKIENVSFLRKNYFYNDLPKGFQLTQLQNSIGHDGQFSIAIYDVDKRFVGVKKIIIDRVQIEEDTANKRFTDRHLQLNFNRCGVPLIEVVTAPSFENEDEVIEFLKILRFYLQKFNISKSRFEEGEIRCDVNISINSANFKGPRTEIKNLNSFANIRKSILQEKSILTHAFINGEILQATTKNFDEKKKRILFTRQKMSEQSYLFFYEPNLPIVELQTSPTCRDDVIYTINESMKHYDLLIQNIDFYDHYAIIFSNTNTIYNLLVTARLISREAIEFFFDKLFRHANKQTIKPNIARALFNWFNTSSTQDIPHSLLSTLIADCLSEKMLVNELNSRITTQKSQFLTESEIITKIREIIEKLMVMLRSKNTEKVVNIVFGKFMQANNQFVNCPSRVKDHIKVIWIQTQKH